MNNRQLKLYICDDIAESRMCDLLSWQQKNITNMIDELYSEIQKNKNTNFINEDRQLSILKKKLSNKSYGVTFAIGDAGYSTAKKIDSVAHCFPNIVKIHITRNEIGKNRYIIVKNSDESIKLMLQKYDSDLIAIVDDTLYSGKTIISVLLDIPKNLRKRTHVICLQSVGESIKKITKYSKMTTGLSLKGKIDKDVSIIRASGLFTEGAIRRKNLPSLAFYERPIWMNIWFPLNADTIINLSRKINDVMKLYVQENKLRKSYSFDNFVNMFERFVVRLPQ